MPHIQSEVLHLLGALFNCIMKNILSLSMVNSKAYPKYIYITLFFNCFLLMPTGKFIEIYSHQKPYFGFDLIGKSTFSFEKQAIKSSKKAIPHIVFRSRLIVWLRESDFGRKMISNIFFSVDLDILRSICTQCLNQPKEREAPMPL